MMSSLVLHTERLLLRPLKEEDAEAIFRLRSDEMVNKYLYREPAKSVDDAAAFIQKIISLCGQDKTVYKTIILPEHNELIGTITLWNFDEGRSRAEIGYELMPSYQGKGYMQEAVKAMIDLAFSQLHVHCIEGWTHPDNIRSNRLLEKLGFERDHEAEKSKPAEAKEIIYSLKRYS